MRCGHSSWRHFRSRFPSSSGRSASLALRTFTRRSDDAYLRLARELVAEDGFLPSQVITSELQRIAYGTDASCYRLTPRLVVNLHSESDVQSLVRRAGRSRLPLTFRAAGTSLSGQASSDSVLARLSPHRWSNKKVLDQDGLVVQLEPGVIGGHANAFLRRFGRKIGPDPSSIDSCMIGGIVSNNSSGMCCGVAQNTYHTIREVRLVMADGTLLDTSDCVSRAQFRSSHGALLDELRALARAVQTDPQLAERIARKFRIKCTTGYSLNALVDVCADDPNADFEILKRLIVGSEGTLAFVSSVQLATVPDHQHAATAFALYDSVAEACEAVQRLRAQDAPVRAVELMDAACLQAAQHNARQHGRQVAGLPLGELGTGSAALLIETAADHASQVREQADRIRSLLGGGGGGGGGELPPPPHFEHDRCRSQQLWEVRRGVIPIAGSRRRQGTAVVLEDVAVPLERLAAFTTRLQVAFRRLHYDDAVVFGHALDGNLHLLFTQHFDRDGGPETNRYAALMEAICEEVVRHEGSLKAEHGTGRNVAPFVEREWGTQAYELMWSLKRTFDPSNILNPGVILNRDPEVHLKALKDMPPVDEQVDSCIECGFCESVCPSRDYTLSPRQRIALLRQTPSSQHNSAEHVHLVEDTCAADGMCATKCPVSINTGALVKKRRASRKKSAHHLNAAAQVVASNFALSAKVGRSLLCAAEQLLPEGSALATQLNRILGHPSTGSPLPYSIQRCSPSPDQKKLSDSTVSAQADPESIVYYVPACVNRILCTDQAALEPTDSLPTVVSRVLTRAGFQVEKLAHSEQLCCGLAFESKGFPELGAKKAAELLRALDQHPYFYSAAATTTATTTAAAATTTTTTTPVQRPSAATTAEINRPPPLRLLLDASPCAQYLRKHADPARVLVPDPAEVAAQAAERLPQLEPDPTLEVCVHAPCSSHAQNGGEHALAVASRCASVAFLSEVPCCGMAGDRVLRYPALSEAAAAPLRNLLRARTQPNHSEVSSLSLSSSSSSSGSTAACVFSAQTPPVNNQGAAERWRRLRGVSTSTTCEIALSRHSAPTSVQFGSLFHLLDEASCRGTQSSSMKQT